MPLPEQLRAEQFADAVEHARALPLLVRLFGASPELVPARVVMKDGRELPLQLEEVDADRQQLVGSDPHGAPMHIALAQVGAVWQRRPLVWRSVSVWGGGIAFGVVVGGLMGALCGAIGGALLARALHDSPTMYRWTRLYGDGAA